MRCDWYAPAASISTSVASARNRAPPHRLLQINHMAYRLAERSPNLGPGPLSGPGLKFVTGQARSVPQVVVRGRGPERAFWRYVREDRRSRAGRWGAQLV